MPDLTFGEFAGAPVGRPRIVVVGDVIDDILVTPSGPISPDTDTPSSIVVRPGGSASNAACWMAETGLVDVTFVGRVAAEDAEQHKRIFSGYGVDARLLRDALLPTGRIVLILDAVEGRRDMLTDRGANAAMFPRLVDRHILDGAAALHLTGYSLFGSDGESGAEVASLVADAHERGLMVSVDPASASGIGKYGAARFLDAIAGADVVFPNADEALELTGAGHTSWALRALREHFDTVAMTLGSHGSLVAAGEGVFEVEAAPAAAVVDPTGAGDAYAAGFMAALVSGRSVQESAERGALLSARAVAVSGGRPAF